MQEVDVGTLRVGMKLWISNWNVTLFVLELLQLFLFAIKIQSKENIFMLLRIWIILGRFLKMHVYRLILYKTARDVKNIKINIAREITHMT